MVLPHLVHDDQETAVCLFDIKVGMEAQDNLVLPSKLQGYGAYTTI